MTNDFAIFPDNVVEMHQEDAQLDEEQMEPLKEMKRQLKADFKEAGWLTGDEISMTVKAYRMMKSESFNLDEFVNVYNALATPMGKN
jgi:hypothetical protein